MSEVTTSDLDQALNIGQQLGEPPTPVSATEQLLKGIIDRLDRTWAAEHAREISIDVANAQLVIANNVILAYAADLASKGLGELANQIKALVREVI